MIVSNREKEFQKRHGELQRTISERIDLAVERYDTNSPLTELGTIMRSDSLLLEVERQCLTIGGIIWLGKDHHCEE